MNNAGQIYAHSLGNIAERLNQQTEERKQQSQLASSLRKTLSLIQPDRKEEFNMQDLGTLQGEFTAIGLKQHLAEQQRQEEKHQAKLKAMLMQQQDMQGANQAIWQMTQPGNAELGNYYENGGERPTARTPSPGELVQALASHGQALNPNADNLLKVLSSANAPGKELADYMPQPFEVGGFKGIVSPRTGSIHMPANAGNNVDDRVKVEQLRALNAKHRTILSALAKTPVGPEQAPWLQRLSEVEGQLTMFGQDPVALADAYANQLREERLKVEGMGGLGPRQVTRAGLDYGDGNQTPSPPPGEKAGMRGQPAAKYRYNPATRSLELVK